MFDLPYGIMSYFCCYYMGADSSASSHNNGIPEFIYNMCIPQLHYVEGNMTCNVSPYCLVWQSRRRDCDLSKLTGSDLGQAARLALLCCQLASPFFVLYLPPRAHFDLNKGCISNRKRIPRNIYIVKLRCVEWNLLGVSFILYPVQEQFSPSRFLDRQLVRILLPGILNKLSPQFHWANNTLRPKQKQFPHNCPRKSDHR